ncbi:MAG: zinc ribbon domain-containing protein [Eubacteriales bacterium]|nr:zinc ribbon domain-containing protein [Eubacteriales bacterium]
MNTTIEGTTYQIHLSDLAAALNQQGLVPNVLSPLPQLLSGPGTGSNLQPDPVALLGQPNMRQVLKIAANPDLIVKSRIGGGSVDLMEFTLTRTQSEGNQLVLVAAAEQSSVLLRLFPTGADFITWFMDHYAGKNDQTVANYMPPTVELGEFLYMLHAIDAFRIASFKGMLAYQAGLSPTLRLSEFTDTLSRSVRSKDIRWLLPSFLVLTPGLDPAGFNLDAEKTRILMTRNFLTLQQEQGSQEQVLGFAEAGQTMGVEFYRTWLVAAGFEVLAAASGGIAPVSRLFVAPTALANHLVQIETQNVTGQPIRVNHQAMTYDQLEQKLNQIFDQALSVPVVPLSSAAAPAPAASVTAPDQVPPAPVAATAAAKPATRFCAQCGSPLQPGAKFCKSCGAKIG